MTYKAIEKLVKAGIQFSETNPPHDRRAILYCRQCCEPVGEYDVLYDSLDTHYYCKKCIKYFIREVPYNITDNIEVLFDNGASVQLKYTGGYYPELVVDRICHFNKKGRFITIKRGYRSKRYYI